MMLSVKKLTPDNWLMPESVMAVFVELSESGGVASMTGERWVSAIGALSLKDTVPEEVRVLFEVARGALVYGFFFYPLYAVGMEQGFRVSESAITHKCRSIGHPKSVRSYAEKIKWLVKQGVIPEGKKDLWHAARELRNMASHPEQQTFVPPGMAITVLARAAEEINALFVPAEGIGA